MAQLIADGHPVSRIDGRGIEAPMPDDATISAAELAQEHRRWYVVSTAKGDVVLRRMPCRLQAAVRQALLHILPSLQGTLARMQELEPYITEVDEEHRDPSKVDEYIRLGDELALHDMRALAVVVSPAVGTIDDWDDFFDSLPREDRDRLELAIGEMSRTRDPSEVDGTDELIAERLGMRIVPRDMIDSMTVSQRAYWMARIEAEARMMRR